MISFEETDQPVECDDEKPLKEWKSKFESGSLSNQDIIRFFQKSTSYFGMESASEGVKCVFNESAARTGIIDVLERFIIGSDNPQVILDKLKSEGNASAVCGRVFKVGEPTYSCRECGMDSTCVLCVGCFKQSPHRFHKYKMSSSSGGGCCDCGDEEAWKKDYICDEHNKRSDVNTESTLITSRMKERCEIVFRAILNYCVKFLEIETHASFECVDTGEPDDNIFCTVLYNDESHTFEQVISTLVKIVKIPQKDAMEMVTSIDREGRAVVRCENFEPCMLLKEAIERQQMPLSTGIAKSPLKVTVLHKRAVSNQQFALQLLTWFQDFLTRHKTFREVFAGVANDKRARNYNIAHILEYDWKLWKTARSGWHRLLISGMLMEYENKKQLAIEFSRHYTTIIQDFIRDDHDHSISIVSLSVQLFTVPTIAHYLIANEAIFFKLMHTFYYECIEKHVEDKTLRFPRYQTSTNVFRRAQYILYDLRYILSFKPEVWTPEIREGFLEGVKVLLKLLNVMQGMDAMYRQTGQHMDYEPEWESAFNLHIKLAGIISLVLEWCSSDRESLQKIYQMVMKHLLDNQFIVGELIIEEQKLAGHVAQCIMYDVSTKNVSIHLPLSRFFSGIYLLLGQYDLNFDNATTLLKRTPEEIIEPILCAQTMVAQVHAGMWRRNGYSLLHQLYFYRNVRCRSEMLDRDIAALQIGAALIESNQYLIHILNKFNLLEWAAPDYEINNTKSTSDDDFIRQLNMIDEFLELLIVVIGERYVPGIANITEEDRTKKEIIQQLCIKNFSHSELNRCLPDSNNETALEDIIDSIAVFKKPSNPETKGVYELKEEFYDDYNMFFYHYTKEEKSKSEETQRLRRKSKGELVCCPPPKLPKLVDGFVSIANLLQCDVMMSTMQTILKRGLDLKAKSFNENHLQKVLYLIGYGLLEEESQNYAFLTFYENATKFEILSLLDKLSHSARVEAHRDFIIWTIKKFKELQPKQKESLENVMDDDDNPPITAAEAEKLEKEERARLAAERRAKIMAQMQNAQKNFMKSNAELFESTSTMSNINEEMECDVRNNFENLVENEEMSSTSIASLGPSRRSSQPEDQKFKCILCFEDCVVSREGPCLVYSAFVQKSRVLTKPRRFDDDVTQFDEDDASVSPYTGTCGHVMHGSCWNQYYDNEILKENRRPNRNRSPNSFTIDKKEFLCPYCRCLSNAVIPLTPPLYQFSTPSCISNNSEAMSFSQWTQIMQNYLKELYQLEASKYTMEYQDGLIDFEPGVDIMGAEFRKKICEPIKKSTEVATQWQYFAEVFMQAVQRVCPYPHASEDSERFLVTWNSCAYTIRSLEMYLRAINKPFSRNNMSIRHKSVLEGLIRVCGMLGSVISSDCADKLMIHLRGMLEAIFRTQNGPCVLEWDTFNMLASLVFLAPAVMYSFKSLFAVPSGNYLEYYFLKVMFLANCAKALILYSHDENLVMDIDYADDDSNEIVISPGQMNSFVNYYRKYNLNYRRKLVNNQSVNLEDSTESLHVPEKEVRNLIDFIKLQNETFLRCSSLLFHFLTDVDFPDELSNPTLTTNTFELMCKYLGLNCNIQEYFEPNGEYIKIIEDFCLHPDVLHYDPKSDTKRSGEKFDIVTCLQSVRELISLPNDYSDLINSISDYTCPNNDREESKNPTMCLVCGVVLCGQSYCCQPELDNAAVGACAYHAHYCGAGIGIFLRIRDCQILYLGVNKGTHNRNTNRSTYRPSQMKILQSTFIPPPYLDEYGETDQGLRRGNPLRLCRERYRKLNLIWLSHGLHEEIARFTDTNAVIATQWQHM